MISFADPKMAIFAAKIAIASSSQKLAKNSEVIARWAIRSDGIQSGKARIAESAKELLKLPKCPQKAQMQLKEKLIISKTAINFRLKAKSEVRPKAKIPPANIIPKQLANQFANILAKIIISKF